jgi:hypothetical protein
MARARQASSSSAAFARGEAFPFAGEVEGISGRRHSNGSEYQASSAAHSTGLPIPQAKRDRAARISSMPRQMPARDLSS